MTTTTMTRSTRRLLRLGAVGLLSVAVLAACGGDDDAADATAAPATEAAVTEAPTTAAATTMAPMTEAPMTDAPMTEAPTTTAVEVVALPDVNEVAVTMVDHSFTMPTELPAGYTRFVATNNGTEEHHLTLAKVPDGMTYADALGLFASDQAAALATFEFFPGPNSIAPGAIGSAIVNLDPGTYIALCVIPGADQVPHAVKGMIAELTVTGDPVDDVDVTVESTATLSDYAFTFDPDFDGSGLLRVDNVAAQPHELTFYRLPDGTTKEGLLELLGTDPASLEPMGGTTIFSNTQSALLELDLPPGTYGLICFAPDATDQLPHFLHDMADVFVVA